MADTIFGIDKGIIRAFALMIIIVGSLTTFFLSEYVATVILGSIFYSATNGTTYTTTTATGETFTAYNTTTAVTELANDNILENTLSVYNNTDKVEIGLANFTIVYAAGNISAINNDYNNSGLAANYTYSTESGTPVPITSDADTFLGTAEDDFVTTFGYVNTGIKFAAALITVVAVILVFASFLPKKGKQDNLGY